MKSRNITKVPGKTKWLSFFILLTFFQLSFFVIAGLSIYALLTFNVKLILFLLFFMIIQYPISKSQTHVNFINDYVQPLQYLKKFKRIYEQNVTSNKSIFCFHPHSVFSYCILANMNADDSIMSQCVGLSSKFMLSVPIMGILFRLWGVDAVDPSNMKKLMSQEKPLGLLPGGFQQATLTTPKQLRIYINNRKGFIKYALQYNYTIYPVLNFNEHKAFWTFDYFLNWRLLLNKIKLPGVIFISKLLVFLPPDVELVTVVGKGIRRKKQLQGTQPTPKQIEDVHKRYINELKRIHKKYRRQESDNVDMKLY